MFDYQPDYEALRRRTDAWWECAVTDRPPVAVAFPRPARERTPFPPATHTTWRERWLDVPFRVEETCARMANTVFRGDALPAVFPNLGPDIFAAYYGCELEFGESTSWSVPCLADWEPDSLGALRLDTESFYFRKTVEFSDNLVEAARGKFIVGYTDLHGGADALAAFRDPQTLCVDMIERPDHVRHLCERITDDFLRVYDFFHDRLAAAGMPSVGWLPVTCEGKCHIPSNDFSCMISDRMFEEVFLPGIERECAHMDRNIYHLDGPQALRYLDRLLDVPHVHAIQWVPGAGRDDWHLWVDVYRRIQNAGKAFIAYPPPTDVDEFMTCLRPEGALLMIGGVQDEDQAAAILDRAARWT